MALDWLPFVKGPFFIKGFTNIFSQGEISMEKFIRGVDRISHYFGILAGVFILLGVALIIGEIVVRNIFNSTIYITQEYTAYFMVAITFFGLAYTLKERGHIRLEFMQRFVKAGKARGILEIYAFAIGFILFAVITYTTAGFFWDSVVQGTRSMQLSKTHLAIPRAAMPLGSFLVTLQFAAEIARTILKIRTGVMKEDVVSSEALGR